MSLTPEERADDSAKGYDLAIGVLREELRISRKALAEIAASAADVPPHEAYGELLARRAIAVLAIEQIQEARNG